MTKKYRTSSRQGGLKWRREKKNKLVESINPEWKDLGKELGF